MITGCGRILQGLCSGATENAIETCKEAIDLMVSGWTVRSRSTTLSARWAWTAEAFGADQQLQRCCNHKIRSENRLEQIARQLEHIGGAQPARRHERDVHLKRLKIPASLHKCLATLIESPHSGVRKRTRNVCRWRDVDMVERWAASAWLLTEKNFRRMDGHKELWAPAALLGREICSSKKQKVA